MAPQKVQHLSSHHHSLLFFLILLLFFSSNQTLSALNSIITSNQSLSRTQKLISDGGKFELGFFQPGNSTYYYIGIWYSLHRVSPLTSVWVANRDTPITDPTTAELKISVDGNLVLSNLSNPLIWSTSATTSSNSNSTATNVAILLDTGNLVLRDGSNPNITLWQSFDHPTNTWLPDAKFGLNKVTGEFQRLISWKNQDDPAPGMFSLEVDPKGTDEYFILWNQSYKYWRTGSWNGKSFSSVPEMNGDTNVYTFGYVSNARENYFYYSLDPKYNIISNNVMDTSGQIRSFLWVDSSRQWTSFWSEPRAQCQVHALCGPFGNCSESSMPFCTCVKGFREKFSSNWNLSDYSGGCVRNTPLQCSINNSSSSSFSSSSSSSSPSSEKDRFYAMPNMIWPDNPQSLQVGSASECELGCLKTCSCTAYSYSSTSGCSVWYEDLLNLQEQQNGGRTGGGTIFLRLAASELPDSRGRKKGVVIGAVAGTGLLLALLVIIVWLLLWRRRGMAGMVKVANGGLVAFRFSDLQHVTKNFSEKLGGGGFGSVFKGVLSNSSSKTSIIVAVKKLEGIRQGEKQFRTEVSTIGTVQHVNLVRLHGFCSEGNHKLLVYEYMPNGSLDTRLFQRGDDSSKKVLDWKTRYQIALGIARGLSYLHEHCRDCIIHCDIKPENILLDASFVPKVADFGLAKLLGRDFSRVLTTMRGTMGYLAPEWISGVKITAKADVYSYGMMLFEIISGKRNVDMSGGRKACAFFPICAAKKLVEGDDVGMLLDCRLDRSEEVFEEEVVRAFKVACWCIQDDENCRPTMSQVVQILEGILEVSMPPVPQTLQALAENPEGISYFSDNHSSLQLEA